MTNTQAPSIGDQLGSGALVGRSGGSVARQAGTVAIAAAAALLLLAGQASAATSFRAGDAGFSIATPSGSTWAYGDSWLNGRFIRNAVTLNGAYVGTIPSGSTRTWFWPGAPFKVSGGRIAMFGAEVAATSTGGVWGFNVLNGFRAEFDPRTPGKASVRHLARSSIVWAAASAEDSKGPIVFGIDSQHHAHAGRPNSSGGVTEVSAMGGTISGQFTVLKEPSGKWWMVGQLPFLSRRVVAYPLSGPTGKVTGPALKLITLPNPGATRWTYAATIHPEVAGLLTWAVNGTGPGTPYGLQKSRNFWPYTLFWARAATTAARRTTASAAATGTVAATSASHVTLWATTRQAQLQRELAQQQQNSNPNTWLEPSPDPLGLGMSPKSGAPAVWELSSKSPTSPIGEDADDDRADFLVPATSTGQKAQQTAAKAAIAAAAAELKSLSDQMKALEAQEKAIDDQAKAAEDLIEAQKRLTEATGTEDEEAARQAEAAAEAAKDVAEAALEAAMAKLELAIEAAKDAMEKAVEAEKKANGKGRSSWD